MFNIGKEVIILETLLEKNTQNLFKIKTELIANHKRFVLRRGNC